jgi:AcrR family transcriptional regulator
MATRTTWLDAGLEVLAAEGAPAVTIESLTTRLGLSKGSYYHHFKGASDFRTALLQYFEAQFTARLIAAVEHQPDAPAAAKLKRLLELVVSDASEVRLEIAIRAWALQDAEARATQERVDKARTDYLQQLCRGLDDVADPDRLARMLYLIFVGAEQVLPSVPSGELHDIFTTTVQLATGKPLD